MVRYARAHENVITLFKRKVKEDPEKEVLKFEGITWTRRQVLVELIYIKSLVALRGEIM